MALATDYRPRNLEEMAGNETLKAALKSKLRLPADKRPHVFLVTGPKGCGKTTIARIIANSIKCHPNEFNEIDATDTSGGVDAVRELKRTIRYAPMAGDVRLWFIDEAHGVSPKGQEAFLKMLEEPPVYAYFVLATTDPQKLIKTLKDRCVVFEVKPLTNKEMGEFITGIAEEERVTIPAKVIKQIVSDSSGHPRAALQILERIIDLPETDMLAAAEQNAEMEVVAIDIARAIMAKGSQWKDIAPLVKGITDYENARYTMLGYCESILLNGKDDAMAAKAALVMTYMDKAFYDSKRAGFTLAVYSIFKG